MDSHLFFDFLSTEVKEESPDQMLTLLSPPITPPSLLFSLPYPPSSTFRRRGSSSALVKPKRPRPYPAFIKDDLGATMSGAAYGTWGASSRSGHNRAQPSAGGRSSDEEDQPPFLAHQFMNEAYLDPQSDLRPNPSSSSLTGAMGDASLSSHPRRSRSPPTALARHLYPGNPQNQDLGSWNTSHMQQNMSMTMGSGSYPGVGGPGNASFPTMGGNIPLRPMNDYSATRNASPESLSPHSPPYSTSTYDAYAAQGSTRSQLTLPQGQSRSPMVYIGQAPSYHASATMPSSSGDKKEDEINRLRRRVQDLEREVSNNKSSMQMMHNSAAASSLPSPPHSAAFKSSWKARTEARKRIYCSLNRAGNALCAWHDSRRERRAYPPRNAPPGFLNCGCTHDEALFEESLSRHGVGSYLPGDTVRMDPALRNPLLKLLQERYGYKDGDFEHDPVTETWFEGESPLAWEKKAQSGGMVKRRSDNERH